MKSLVIFLLAAFCLFSCTVRKNSDHRAILKVLEDQREAWNRGDLEGYMQGYHKSDSLLFIGKNGPKYGWETTFGNYKKAYPDKVAMGFLIFDIKSIKFISGNHAFVMGGWHLKRQNDELQGYFTLVLKKIDRKWKIISDHSS